MKDQPLKLAIALAAACLLSACASSAGNKTATGMEKPVMAVQKTAVPEAVPAPPQSPEPVFNLTPPQSVSPPAAVPDKEGLVWHRIDNYDAAHPSLPGAQETQPLEPLTPPTAAIRYNPSVDVYPVGPDRIPYAYAGAETAYAGANAANSVMIQQIFFPYGSSRVNKKDSHELREIARSLTRAGNYRLDVVGHASKRVDHVRDPIKREMINFKMAQKRANAVTSVLLKAGASPDWVVSTSVGDSQPNPHRHGKSQEAADRRTEVYLNN